jgi:DNA-binding LacI/PurR family transcriptional regulator
MTHPDIKTAVTSTDVAVAADMSQSTVSLILSGKAAGRVSEATRARVIRVSGALGYRPNAAARHLREGRTNTIGLFIPGLGFPFFADVAAGIDDVLAEHALTVFVATTENDAGRQDLLAEALDAHNFDGLVLCSVAEPTAETLRHFAGRLVAIENQPKGAPAVLIDRRHSADVRLDHLIALGHRRIAHLGGMGTKTTYRIARKELQAAARRAGITLDDRHLGEVQDISLPHAVAAATGILTAKPRPTAILCDDAIIAAGIYAAAADLGLRIPDDVSVIAEGDSDWAQTLRPPLTTVALPGRELGRVAAHLLVRLLAGDPVPSRSVVNAPLIVRDSTALAHHDPVKRRPRA